MVSPLEGFLQVKIDGLDMEVGSVQSRIETMTQRLAQKRTTYVRQYASLERQLSMLQMLQQRLSAALATLPKVSF